MKTYKAICSWNYSDHILWYGMFSEGTRTFTADTKDAVKSMSEEFERYIILRAKYEATYVYKALSFKTKYLVQQELTNE